MKQFFRLFSTTLFYHLLITNLALPVSTSNLERKLIRRSSSRVKGSHHLVRSVRSADLIIGCSDPGTPLNSQRIIQPILPQPISSQDYFPVRTRIIYSCNSGYLLNGSGLLTCRDGNTNLPSWDASIPQCVGKDGSYFHFNRISDYQAICTYEKILH